MSCVRGVLATLGCLLFAVATGTHAATLPQYFIFTPAPPQLVAAVEFAEPSGNRILDAEETAGFTVSVENRGRGDGFEVVGAVEQLEGPEGLQWPERLEFETVAAGSSVTRSFQVAAPREIGGGPVTLLFSFADAAGFAPDPVRLTFDTLRFLPPELVVEFQVEDFDKNRRIQPAETAEVTARVINQGPGPARNVAVRLRVGDGVTLMSPQTRFQLGDLRSGESKEIQFGFFTNKGTLAARERIPIDLEIAETRVPWQQEVPFPLPLDGAPREIREVRVSGVYRDRADVAGTMERVADVDYDPPAGARPNPDAVAVVIGNHAYDHLPAVDFAQHDAAIVREYLLATFGLRADNIEYQIDADLADFNRLFGRHEDATARIHHLVEPGRSDLYVYYSGHGSPALGDKRRYLIPANADPDQLEDTGYSLDLLYSQLASTRARSVTLILDACFSGDSAAGWLHHGMSPTVLKSTNPVVGLPEGTVFSAAGADQVAFWYPAAKHSLFTYYLLKGLRGDADRGGDGVVTVAELKDYLGAQVPRKARRLRGREQTPWVTGRLDRVLVTF